MAEESTFSTVEEDTFVQTFGDYNSKNFEVIQYMWVVNFENKTKKKNPEFKQDYLNVDTLITGLKKLYPNITLAKIKISGNTLFTGIKDSEYLGERMGSSGASAYIADVIINLTSVKNIIFYRLTLTMEAIIHQVYGAKGKFRKYKEVN